MDLPIVCKSILAASKAFVREKALQLLAAASRARGADCLSRDQTIDLCSQLGYSYIAGEPTTFELGNGIESLEIMACGVVRLNQSECLYTDFGNRTAALDFKKPSVVVEHAIALWSHPWLGFHHFLSEVAPKICKLRRVFGHDLGGAIICFPMIKRRYEADILRMLEIPTSSLLDSKTAGGVVAKKLTFIPMAGWFQGNPNANLLREDFLRHASEGPGGPERLYLSRSGRRRCLNDDAIIARCKELGFEVVDESSRTIAEQIDLYRNAKVLIGPHGSAFTNMVWTKPGTRIIEIVPSSFDVPYHTALAKSLGHRHTKVICYNGPKGTSGENIDFNADIDEMMTLLEEFA
jgi:capsular polysaccharide biosynthesis protein